MVHDTNSQWQPIKDQIMTRWAKEVDPKNPLPEYPRPQLRREDWLSLNGLWDYAILPKQEEFAKNFQGKILVPFPVESALSGVGRKLKPNQKLWYYRNFKIPKSWLGKKILLHFGAVDWETEIWVNKNVVGTHKGGYTPFKFEISDFLTQSKENEIILSVWDPSDKGRQERGKQSLKPSFITYTAVSGIWQTVWLEPVSETYIESLKMVSNIDNETLKLSVNIKDQKRDNIIHICVFNKENQIITEKKTKKKDIILSVKLPNLWSPESPYLYSIKVKIERDKTIIDNVESYFGMRKISLSKTEYGIKHIELNNKPLFQYGTLDQGYWPDGLYTAPTDKALRYDIDITKELGFNMIRKHVKMEPARWYYHCDKKGILVWQDMPNGGFIEIVEIPNNIKDRKETRYESDKKNYLNELDSMIKTLINSPSIVAWVPFNEGWGQFDTEKVVNRIRKLDPSRLVDAASGWYDVGVGDICDRHSYPNPIMPQKDKIITRAAVVGEFGGLGLEIKDHMWSFQKSFVYRNFPDKLKLTKRYERLVAKLKMLIQKGLSAAVYTQITDVEQEINGLLTYDREIIKLDKEKLLGLNISLYHHSRDYLKT